MDEDTEKMAFAEESIAKSFEKFAVILETMVKTYMRSSASFEKFVEVLEKVEKKL